MDYQYSETMKTLMKSKPGIAVKIFLRVLIVLAVLGSIFSVLSENASIKNQKADVQEFNPFGTEENYSKLTPTFLSEEYASNYNDKIFYCLAVDEAYNTFVVAINADEMDKYQDLIDYTYDEAITTPPEDVILEGIPKEIDAEMVSYTVEAFNVFTNSDSIDASNYQTIIGSYYLDTTSGPASNSSGFILFLILAVLLVLLYGWLMMRAEKAIKTRKATLEKYNSYALKEVDQELNQPDTLHLNELKVHFTNRYIISAVGGFDIIPYEDVKQVYGEVQVKTRNHRAVIAVTKDDVKHEIAIVGDGNNQDALLDRMIERIKLAAPDIMYGVNEESFFILVPKNSGMVFHSEDDANAGESKVGMGILGAVIGALLGGVIWIIIGEIGFIAGLVGYLMMIFAIKGYQMLSGYLDKKGQIISIVIALIMIFVSNYMLYALQYCEGFYDSSYSFNNIIASIKALPEFLKIGEVRSSFIRDLIVGYLLSIWAGYRIIASAFIGKSKKEE